MPPQTFYLIVRNVNVSLIIINKKQQMIFARWYFNLYLVKRTISWLFMFILYFYYLILHYLVKKTYFVSFFCCLVFFIWILKTFKVYYVKKHKLIREFTPEGDNEWDHTLRRGWDVTFENSWNSYIFLMDWAINIPTQNLVPVWCEKFPRLFENINTMGEMRQLLC